MVTHNDWADFKSVADEYGHDFAYVEVEQGYVILNDSDLAGDILWAIGVMGQGGDLEIAQSENEGGSKMDSCQIVSLALQVGLIFLTAVLAYATYKLHRSTKRYADLTEKALDLESLIFVERSEKSLVGPKGQRAVTVFDLMKGKKEMHLKATDGYNRLYARVLDNALGFDDVFKGFIRRETESDDAPQ